MPPLIDGPGDAMLDPIEGLDAAGDGHLCVMRKDLAALREALGGSWAS
jgi:hypothetical protein